MLRAVAAAVIAAVLGCTAGVLCADDAPPKKVALLVGVNKYLKPGFKDLGFAEADVTAVGAELGKLGFEVTILLGSKSGADQATLANIETTARRLFSPLGQRDIALVMLSGHGQQLLADPTELDIDKSQSFFCPVDARSNDPRSQFSLTHLLDDILARDVGRKMVLVDACRDLAADGTTGVPNTKGIEGRRINLPEDTAIYFSCRAGQQSLDVPALGHGLFTHCVLEALRGDAAGVNGEVSWSRLVAHVDDRMQQPDIVKHMGRFQQVPIPAGAIPFTVLGRLDTRRPVTPPMPTAPRPAPVTARGYEGSSAGEQRDDNGLAMKLRWCPDGTFTMGSPANEPGRGPDENQARVTLTRGFWLGQYEVTQSEWQQVMGTTLAQQRDKAGSLPLFGDGPRRPIYYVSHDEATKFCAQLTQREQAAERLPVGWAYRLPTEAEWEYACRAGTETATAFGNGLSSTHANFSGDYPYNGAAAGVYLQQTSDVGSYPANAWGLCDMHGNVWEWCSDWYAESLRGGRDPEGRSEQATARVIRGGGWLYPGQDCRAAIRRWDFPPLQRNYLGFRVAAARTN